MALRGTGALPPTTSGTRIPLLSPLPPPIPSRPPIPPSCGAPGAGDVLLALGGAVLPALGGAPRVEL